MPQRTTTGGPESSRRQNQSEIKESRNDAAVICVHFELKLNVDVDKRQPVETEATLNAVFSTRNISTKGQCQVFDINPL